MDFDLKTYQDMTYDERDTARMVFYDDVPVQNTEVVYSGTEVQDAIDTYLARGGSDIVINEGVCGWGSHILTNAGNITTVIWEVPINCWTSTHVMRFYRADFEPLPIQKILYGLSTDAIISASEPDCMGWDAEDMGDLIWKDTGEFVELPSYLDPLMKSAL